MNRESDREEFLRELVFRGVESDELDYKAAMSWNTMSRSAKGKIVRHLTAFANTKGGFLVIGVSEDRFGNPVCRTGVSADESGSFDPTPVGNFVNAHIEPPIDFTIDRPVIDGRHYVIFSVRRFSAMPHVCCKPVEGELQSGVFYIRTSEASSRPAYRALEMHQLIRRTMRNEREQLGRMLRGILYDVKAPVSSESIAAANDIIDESTSYFNHRVKAAGAARFRMTVRPDTLHRGRFDVSELRTAVNAAWRLRPGAEFLCDGETSAHATPGSLRYFSREKSKMWQLFDNGVFGFWQMLTSSVGELHLKTAAAFCIELVSFLADLYAELECDEELLTIRFELFNAENLSAVDIDGRIIPAKSSVLSTEICRSAADLASGSGTHALRLIHNIGELFHLSDRSLDKLAEAAGKLLAER